jgi:hypothetical protein
VNAGTFAAEAIADRAVVGIVARTAADPQDIRGPALAVVAEDGREVDTPVAAGADPVWADPVWADPAPAGLAPNPVQAARAPAGIVQSAGSARNATTGAVGRQQMFDLID